MGRIKNVSYGQYFMTHKDGQVFRADQGFFNISGYTQQDLDEGKINFYNLIPEEDKDEYLAIVDKETQSMTKPVLLRHPFRRKNGSAVYVLCLGVPVEVNGEPVEQITITDYSEHMNLRQRYDNSIMELDTLMSNVPGGVAVLRDDGKELYILKSNEEFHNSLDLDENSVLMSDCLNEDDLGVLLREIHKSECTGEKITCELKFMLKSGKVRWFRILGNLYKYSEGKPLLYILLFDITKERMLTKEVEVQAEKFKVISENTSDMYYDYDVIADRMIITGSEFSKVMGKKIISEKVWRRNLPQASIHPDDWEHYKQVFDEIRQKQMHASVEFRCNAFDEDYTWFRAIYISTTGVSGKVEKIFGKISSISDEKNMEKKIHNDTKYINYLLETDSTTGLLNRKAFIKKCEELFEKIDIQENEVYAFVYSDINDFSYVNDNFGYEAGNVMLGDFGKMIQDTPTVMLSCRIYSDFFVGLYKSDTRENLVKSIEKRNNDFYNLQREKYPASNLQISCGVYFVTSKDIDINVAIDNANLARRSIKSSKDVQLGLYAKRMRIQRVHEQEIASEIHSAIENRNIELFMQPKFSMSTREIIGAEALARWRNPDGTYKMPYEFIHVLEKVGYIDELDFFIYEEVLRTMDKWKKLGKEIIPVSVNFSRFHVNKSGFVDRIIDLADKYKVDKSKVEIEITESFFEEDTQTLFSDMKKLRDCNFKVDMDDFGIGYSTLSVLMKAPIDIVKIDKSFIDNLESSELNRDYVKNICHLIDLVHKDIIFEGVESEGQAKILVDSGYTKAQGWLFDKARPLKEFNHKYMGIDD